MLIGRVVGHGAKAGPAPRLAAKGKQRVAKVLPQSPIDPDRRT